MKIAAYFLILFALIYSEAQSQWNISNTGFSQLYVSISAVDNNTVWTCGHLSRVARTVTGGANWSISTVAPDSANLVNIFGIDQNTALVVSQKTAPKTTKVWKTVNGGIIWSEVFSQSNGAIHGIEISPSGIGFMVGDPVGGRWSLWKTTNSGSTWDSTGMYLAGTGNGYDNCLYVNGSNYWFGASSGRIFHSTNSGTSWTSQTVGTTTINGIWFNDSTGIASGSQKYITTNGGANWTILPGAPATSFLTPITGSGTNFYMCTTGSVNIYSSTNLGNTWTNYASVETKGDIAMSRTGNKIWVSTFSERVLYGEGGTGINNISNEIPERFSLEQNYPNPFNPSTKIRFNIAKTSDTRLTVYDMLGKEAAPLVNEKLQAGKYEYTFDGADLVSGVYFYKLETNGFTETKKMLLVK